MRPTVGSSQALSGVNGSRATVTRWNVVSHSRSVWADPLSGVSSRSAGAASVTIGRARYQPPGSRPNLVGAAVACAAVHPIERLRYVARAGDVDPAMLV